jgi:hypothetical protein
MPKEDEARRLLGRVGILRNACDLDLLIFFVRHPRALLSSESLAGFLGYNLKDIADSLEVLLAGGLLHRKQTPAHAARLYELANGDANHEWVASLLEFASTRPGRLALKETLVRRSQESTDGPVAAAPANTMVPLDRLPKLNVRRTRRRGGR